MNHRAKLLILSSLVLIAATIHANSVTINYCNDSSAYKYTNFTAFFPDGTNMPLEIKKGESKSFSTIFPSFRLNVEGTTSSAKSWNAVAISDDQKNGLSITLPVQGNYYISTASITDSRSVLKTGINNAIIAKTDKCPTIHTH